MKIRYFALLRDVTHCREEDWHQPAATVGELVHALVARYGREFERWVTSYGEMWNLVLILVNGHDIRTLQGFDTPLSPEDTVVIFPPVGGG